MRPTLAERPALTVHRWRLPDSSLWVQGPSEATYISPIWFDSVTTDALACHVNSLQSSHHNLYLRVIYFLTILGTSQMLVLKSGTISRFCIKMSPKHQSALRLLDKLLIPLFDQYLCYHYDLQLKKSELQNIQEI